MTKKLMAGVIILLVIIIGFLLINKPKDTSIGSLGDENEVAHPTQKACTMEAKICPDGTSVGRTGPNCEFAECPKANTFSWNFKEAKEVAGVPMTEVSFSYNGKTYDAGSYEGGCSEVDNKSWKLLAGEKYGAICWFAGGGSEIGIFEEGGGLVAKKGLLDEGDAETAGTRGNFQTLVTLN